MKSKKGKLTERERNRELGVKGYKFTVIRFICSGIVMPTVMTIVNNTVHTA